MTAPVAVPLFPWHVDPPYSGRGRRPRAQAAVLAVVRASIDGASVGALAAASGRSSPNVRRCLRSLEAAGLVRRLTLPGLRHQSWTGVGNPTAG